jgi:hypothetical protein
VTVLSKISLDLFPANIANILLVVPLANEIAEVGEGGHKRQIWLVDSSILSSTEVSVAVMHLVPKWFNQRGLTSSHFCHWTKTTKEVFVWRTQIDTSQTAGRFRTSDSTAHAKVWMGQPSLTLWSRWWRRGYVTTLDLSGCAKEPVGLEVIHWILSPGEVHIFMPSGVKHKNSDEQVAHIYGHVKNWGLNYGENGLSDARLCRPLNPSQQIPIIGHLLMFLCLFIQLANLCHRPYTVWKRTLAVLPFLVPGIGTWDIVRISAWNA